MSPVKCTNCRLSLPQNWTGMNDPDAKCPYCGKPFAAAPVAAAPPTATAPGPAAPSVSRPGGPAKTMLWGATAPIPGVPKLAVADTAYAGSGPSDPAGQVPAQSPIPTAGSAATTATLDEGSGAVRIDPPADSKRISSKVNQPAATVMFEQGGPIEPARPSFERADTEPRPASPVVPREEMEQEQLTAPVTRPTPSKLKAKAKPVPKKGEKGFKPRSSGSTWGAADAPAPTGDKKKAAPNRVVIIAIAGAVLVAFIIIGGLALRHRTKPELPATEPPKTVTEPTPSEPTPSEEPAGLAVKPVPTEAVVPPPKPAEPTPGERGAREPKPTAEKDGHGDKTPPSDKGKPTTAEPPSEKHETKGKHTSEADIQRANELYQRGNTKMFQGNTTDAIADFHQALKLNPADPSIHRGLGLAFAQAGKSSEAAKHLKLYLKASPKATDRAVIQKRIHELR